MHPHKGNITLASRTNLLARLLFREQFQAKGHKDDPTGPNQRIFLDIWLTYSHRIEGLRESQRGKIETRTYKNS